MKTLLISVVEDSFPFMNPESDTLVSLPVSEREQLLLQPVHHEWRQATCL